MDIFEEVNGIIAEINAAAPADADALEQFRIKYLGSKNIIKPIFGKIKEVPNERKKEFGQLVNSAKQAAQSKFDELKAGLSGSGASHDYGHLDYTRPVDFDWTGSKHPVSLVMNRIIDIFQRIGFAVAEEREIEDDLSLIHI